MAGGSLPDIDDLNIARLLATRQPVRDMLLPSEGPFVIVERLRLRLETWRQISAEASARGVEPEELLAQLIEAVMSPALQQVISQFAHRAAPSA
jgi:hypothetical protein